MVWQRLLQEGQRLNNSSVTASLAPGFCQNTAFQLLQAVSRGLQVANSVLNLIPSDTAEPALGIHVVRCAAGYPGRSGCTTVDGTSVLWHRLVESPWSAATAMEKLGLRILGLPAARLPAGIPIPGAPHLRLLARGGPSYHSCAVLWRIDTPFVFDEIVDVWSCCRCWVGFFSGYAGCLCGIWLPCLLKAEPS